MTLKDKEQGLRKRIGSDNLIGCYSRNEDGQWCMKDVRGEQGHVIDFENQSDIEIAYRNDDLQQDVFYIFKWGLTDEGTIIIKDMPRPVDHRLFLQGLYDSRTKLEGEVLKTYNDFQATIFNEVTGAQHTYLYELLQNANDYPYMSEKVKVKFVLTDHYLFFMHSGAAFNLRNIVGICSINQGEKRKNTKTIGYKGIGFKSVFVRNDVVYLKSDDWMLRFDEGYANNLYYGKSPWALIPIPTNDEDLDNEVKEVFGKVSETLRVKFALHDREDAQLHLPQLDKVFSDNQILLFIPNVDDVEVIVDGELRHHVIKDEEKWVVTNYEDYKVPDELREWVAANINSGDKIPEKFKDIENIRISFAIARDGKNLVPVPNARVYNYLPTELKLGFSFLFNADFVPNGSRSGLHDVKWNDHVMTQCGRYFVRWWTAFMENEVDYNLQSVFDILPFFDSRDHYARLFEEGAWKELENVACIPTLKGGYHLCKLKDIIYDRIGFTNTSNPVMSDEEFYSIVGGEQCLPHPAIRESAQLYGLLSMLDGGCNFDSNHLTNLAFNKSFLSWLKDKENYLRFFRFVVDNDYIVNFLGYSIFRKWDGTMMYANALYYNIDEYLEDVDFLAGNLPYLDADVREILDKSQRQKDIRERFKRFVPELFASEILEHIESHAEAFLSLDNNASFIHFLAKIEYRHQLPSSYPFQTTTNGIATDTSTLYQYSEGGEELSQHSWINKEWINFLNDAYTRIDGEKVSSYLEKQQGIVQLTAQKGYERIISNKNYIPSIAESIKDKESSIDFFQYLYSIQNSGIPANFTEYMRINYTVLTHDGSDNTFWTPLRQTIFWQSEEWKEVATATWMIDGICVAIDDFYLDSLKEEERESFKKYLNTRQVTQEFSVIGLYNPTLRNVAKDILSGITTIEKSYDLLSFLHENRKTLRDINKTFAGIPVKCKGNEHLIPLVDTGEQDTYIANEDMLELCAQPWLDVSSLRVADERYTDLFERKESRPFFVQFGLTVISKTDYVINEILPSLNDIRPMLTERNNNISFHRFFMSLSDVLGDKDWKDIQEMPIYISSNTSEAGVLADNSNDHYLPTEELQNAINLDIVPAEIMDSIHKDYIQSQDDQKYFVEKLGNAEIDTDGFVYYVFYCADKVIPYLREKERNIRFWRWLAPLKESLRKIENRDVIRKFPILIKGAENNEPCFADVESLYLSDEYSKLPLESFVKRFVKDATFISEQYATEEFSDNDKSMWTSLFSMAGAKTDIKDVVFTEVIPNLCLYKETDIILLLAKYYEDIKRKFERDDDGKFREQMASLQLQCEDGNYQKVAETVIAGAYFGYDSTTLPEVVIQNSVVSDYLDLCGEDKEQRRSVATFMRLLADKFDVGLENSTMLTNAKISYFLKHQNAYKDEDIHYSIIGNLSNLFNKDPYGVRELIEKEQTSIYLYTATGNLRPATNLTLHTVYNPDCDFAGHGVTTEREFVSPLYEEYSSGNVGSFLKFLRVHHRFFERDLDLLRIEEFAIYFWQEYAPSREEILKEFCIEEKLKNVYCIPTSLGVKRPSEVYDSRNEQLKKIVQLLPNTDGKLPTVTLPKWVNHIGFRWCLTFLDCLTYLSLNLRKHDYRQDVYKWMVTTPDEGIRKYQSEIESVRESVLWYNGQKEWVPLKDLYALEWSDRNSTLKDNFSTNGGICNPSYMPEYKTDYDRLCSILGIRVLTDKDFEKHKDKNAIRDEKAISEFKKRLLYLAFKSTANWKEKYAEYCKKLDEVDVSKCESISYSFNEKISTELRAYCDNPSYLWYVGNWDGNMFIRILDWFKKNFNLTRDNSYLERLFLTPFNTFVTKEENGCVPNELLDFLSDEDKAGLSVEEQESAEKFDEIYSVPKTGSFTDWKEKEPQEPHEPMQNSNQDNIDESHTAKHSSTLNTKVQTEKKGSRSDKGGTHDYPSIRQTDVASHDNNELKPAINETDAQTERPSVKERLEEKWNRKKNGQINKPGSAGNDDSFVPIQERKTGNDRPDEPFFNPNYNHENTYINKGTDRTAANIKRRDSEAQEKAELAHDEMSLYSLFQQTPKYTYLWFKYLMELKHGSKDNLVSRNTQLDFIGFHLSSNDQTVDLYNPSKAVPRWLEQADKLSVHVIGKTSRNLPATIVKVDTDNSCVELMIDAKDASLLEGCEKIRMDATCSANIIDSLETRFLQLDFDDDFNMEQELPTNLEFIYGPPGTGKTTRLVKRLHELVAESEGTVNILVLTPTNKAADVIATKITEDELCYNYLTRFGATESRFLIEDAAVVQTRDTLDMTLLDKNIVVTTAARYAYDYVQPEDTAICDFEWNYIVIDEASMMDLLTITYIIYKGKPMKYIIAGDPKQISPIKENNIEESELNIYDMVGLESFRDAIIKYTRYPIEALTTQYRSVPNIGKLVSDFAYNSIVKPYPNRAPQKPLQLDGIPTKDINFIGFKTEEFDMLYGLTSVGESAFHLYSAIFTYNFVGYIADQLFKKYPNSHYTVGVVCPYRAQADAIQQMFDNRSLNNSVCEISSGTVHKFQGDECDIMIVVLNPPANCTSGAHINNENIINVAMSRARDYLFFIVPDNRINNFYMRERLGNIVDNSSRQLLFCSDIEKVMLGDANFIGDNTCVTCHLPVNVYYDNRALYEVRIDDKTIDIQIND